MSATKTSLTQKRVYAAVRAGRAMAEIRCRTVLCVLEGA